MNITSLTFWKTQILNMLQSSLEYMISGPDIHSRKIHLSNPYTKSF